MIFKTKVNSTNGAKTLTITIPIGYTENALELLTLINNIETKSKGPSVYGELVAALKNHANK